MEREWHNIISFNGSQNAAFEELVCQIARCEENIDFVHFERFGTPDGGVECIWELNDGTKWGWQAKYFQTLESTEWNCIKDSLYSAIETYPELTKYFICVPHNLSNGRGKKQTQNQKWEQYKSKWTSYILTSKGKIVELILWNSSLLLSKLLIGKLSGTRRYFFKEIDINEEALNLQLTHSIKDLGPKYNSALNLKIENIVRPFNALARNSAFQEDFTDRIDKVLRKLDDTTESLQLKAELNEYQNALSYSRISLFHAYKQIDFSPATDIPVESIIKIVKNAYRVTNDALNYCVGREEQDKNSRGLKRSSVHSSGDNYTIRKSRYDTERYELRGLEELLWEFDKYLNSDIFIVTNSKLIVLNGKWGVGKSHLLADIALSRREDGIASILLLGSKFADYPPRNFIQQTLCPQVTFDNYLSALNAFAQTKKERLFLIIDGINEGKGRYVWKDNLNSLISEFSAYKWIGLIISYRSNYDTVLLPDGFNFPQITHEGFRGIEDVAIKSFFNHYRIQQTVPYLNSEFSNPLFLKIFCSTIQGLSLDRIPEGFDGITAVFEGYINWINRKIGERLRYSPKSINLVQKAIERLTRLYLNENHYFISYEKANIEVDEIFAPYCSTKNNIDELIKEGLLIENQYFDTQASQYLNGVTLSYERITDHFKAQYLLGNIALGELKKTFEKDGYIYPLIVNGDGNLNAYNTGLITSLAILLPEKYGIELHEVMSIELNHFSANYLYEITLESCLWRRTHTITESMWVYIKKHLEEYNSEGNEDIFFSTLLQLSANKGNYLNARFLHSLLQSMPINLRDAAWSIPIDRLYTNYRNNPVTRIIEWCWSKDIKQFDIDDEVTLNLGITLSWFFTNSNRYIRDKATKGFVSLFSTKPHLLKSILVLFENVNDPYVLERVLAGIYGATTRISHNPNQQKAIAQYVYDKYFKSRLPPINIVTRDYCKGIVEFALNRGISLQCSRKKLYPPFNYKFPQIPDKHQLLELISDRDRKSSLLYHERGLDQIVDSVLHNGDFSRYIIGTNFGYSSFSAYSIAEKKAFEKIKKTLTDEHKEAFNMYVDAVEMIYSKSQSNMKRGIVADDVEQENNNIHSIANNYFETSLSPKEFAMFKLGSEYLKNLPSNNIYNMRRFDLGKVQAYILERVLDIGWSEDYFGQYDSKVDSKGRDSRKAERIGKKYQWIALYEILALLTDNYYYYDKFLDSESNSGYRGSWQEHVRNIDPTIINKISTTSEQISTNYNRNYWWFNVDYNNWSETRKTWLKHFDDIPDFRRLILPKESKTSAEFYTIYSSYRWEQKKNVGENSNNSGHKDIWADVTAFIVKEETKLKLIQQAQERLLWGRDNIPLHPSYTHTYKGEFYQAEQYNKEEFAYIDIGDTTIPVIMCSDEYNFESGYDCSNGKNQILYPSKYLFELLSAEFGENDACIYDKTGEIIGFDTAAFFEKPHQSLLVKREKIDAKLKDRGLEIVWHFWGEKEDIGPRVSYVDRMLFSGILCFENGQLQIYSFHKEQTAYDE